MKMSEGNPDFENRIALIVTPICKWFNKQKPTLHNGFARVVTNGYEIVYLVGNDIAEIRISKIDHEPTMQATIRMHGNSIMPLQAVEALTGKSNTILRGIIPATASAVASGDRYFLQGFQSLAEMPLYCESFITILEGFAAGIREENE